MQRHNLAVFDQDTSQHFCAGEQPDKLVVAFRNKDIDIKITKILLCFYKLGSLAQQYWVPWKCTFFFNEYELCWTKKKKKRETFLWHVPSKMNHEGRNLRKKWFGATNGGRDESVNLMKSCDRGFIRTRLTAEGVEGLHVQQRIDMILLRMAGCIWH